MKFFLCICFLALGHFAHSQKYVKAIKEKDTLKLQKWYDKGGDLNERVEFYTKEDGEFSYNLLSYSVGNECMDCIHFFLNKKDEFDDFDLVLSEAFIFSLAFSNKEISELLFSYKPIAKGICDACHGNNALMVAATYGNEEWYFKLKPTSDLSYINAKGASLLHNAAYGPSKKILHDVLQIPGLDINLKDAEGETPLDYAAQNDSNQTAFKTLLEHGADHLEAKNLLFWWCQAEFKLTPGQIQDRREDIWELVLDDHNALMMLSYCYKDMSADVFMMKLKTVVHLMLEDFEENNGRYDFVEPLYYESITDNFLDAMVYLKDQEADDPIYPIYLELLGYLCNNHDFCPVYKKEFKRAIEIYGEEVATKWYAEFNIPEE